MELKTVTWNIGGGKLLEPGKDPGLMSSYTVDGLDDIAAKLESYDPAIITLQEVEGSSDTSQVEYVARKLGREYFFYDPTSDSHLDTSQRLGNGLISKYPISKHRSGLFLNPNVEFDLEGMAVTSHNKGYGQCLVDIGDKKICVTTLHLLPFRRMGIELDSDIAASIYGSVAGELYSEESYQLIQGDFNIDSATVGAYLRMLFEQNDLIEISLDAPTTPKNRKYDHVLMKGIEPLSVEIDAQVKTDHYPVISKLWVN